MILPGTCLIGLTLQSLLLIYLQAFCSTLVTVATFVCFPGSLDSYRRSFTMRSMSSISIWNLFFAGLLRFEFVSAAYLFPFRYFLGWYLRIVMSKLWAQRGTLHLDRNGHFNGLDVSVEDQKFLISYLVA
jgi:FtsH-binding integral membrane protein